MAKSKWEDISDILTEKGKRELKVGQVLIFDYEGSSLHMKIMRKTDHAVWAKRIRLYKESEVRIEEKVVDNRK